MAQTKSASLALAAVHTEAFAWLCPQNDRCGRMDFLMNVRIQSLVLLYRYSY